ncbi:MAG: DinB family protein [Bacteroidetes bacterium]|nr:DinB family protein [Bacteroidota bacterium]
MKTYLLKLYQYNAWANRRVIGCLERQAVTDEKIVSIFAHCVAANFIWYNRFMGLPKSDYKLWGGGYTIADLKKMVEEANELWMSFIDSNNSFDRVLKYHNYVGDYYENNIQDIMIHLVNHGSYHRGQVAVLLRERGYEPINTDLITYDRVLLGQWKD